MGLEVITIPCLSDNYAFLVRDDTTGEVALFDVPEAAPIAATLRKKGWSLNKVFLTHHHADHVQGLTDLELGGIEIIGAAADAHRLPPLTHSVSAGDRVSIGESTGVVWDVSGHTVGHVAFIFDGYAFTGDSLMALGCGRLFEGTAAQMWQSLSQFDALPDETWVCSGHEYTAANARFAATVEPQNGDLAERSQRIAEARTAGRPTVPSLLSDERATNPFLRAALPAVKREMGMEGAEDAAVFAEIRARKDRF